MSVTLTNLVTEVQARCDALTNFSLIETVIDCAIAAKKVEMAGGSITRTTLDTQVQRFVTASGSGSVIEDLIALAASVEVRTGTGGKTLKVQEFLTTGTWTRPAGVDSVEVLLVGGGGGGGYSHAYSSTVTCGSGSGGGGGVVKKVVPVTSISVGSTVTVSIGAGGAAGTSSVRAGAGGTSTFGSLLTAGSGGGGDGYSFGSYFIGGAGTATSGGEALQANNCVAVGGLGGGAGGSPEPTVIYSTSATSNVTASDFRITGGLLHFPGTTGVINTQVGNTSAVDFHTASIPKVAEPLYGYGAGGGIYCVSRNNNFPRSVNGACGSGGGSVASAVANSGGGGAGCLVKGTAQAGGAGGSGYCLVTWWE